MAKVSAFLFLLVFFITGFRQRQENLAIRPTPFIKIGLENYSTSYKQEDKKTPFLVTAIPYNGMYSNFENFDPTESVLPGPALKESIASVPNSRWLYTFDSAEVFFMAPYISPGNGKNYEFRITLNGDNLITPWTDIEKYTDSSMRLGTFPANMAWLGGYKTRWDNFLLVELRVKGQLKNLSVAVVYWKQIKPVITAIYTTAELNDFLKMLKRPWDRSIVTPYLPAKAVLGPGNNNLIIYLSADIYKKDAIEYSLLKQGSADTGWKANDFDNNFIWLRGLSHGRYTLRIRYARQRHNITAYLFEIKPYWYQTLFFKVALVILAAAFLGFIVLYFRFRAQKQKLREANLKKEKTATELKAIRSQLNPHFVFNALGSIQGLINTNNIDAANRYLSGFGSLMRDTLTGSNKTSNSIFHEMNLLKNYLELEQLRFHFLFRIAVDQEIDVSATEIPSLLLQPLVENAVKHGVSALGEKGMILIEVKKENTDINVLIRDNGAGMPTGENTPGFGLKLTRDRIVLLDQLSKQQKITLNMESDAGNGTTVYLNFKNWLA